MGSSYYSQWPTGYPGKDKIVRYLGIDNLGNYYHIDSKYPRKWLLNHLYRKHCDKMYCDMADGTTKHTGYIIAGVWITIYKISDWR